MGEMSGRLGGEREELGEEPERRPSTGSPDAQGARWLRRRIAAAVTAVTTVTANQFRASTVTTSFVASIEPLLVLVALEAHGQMAEWIEGSRVFGLNVLAWRDQLLADRFAGLAPRAPPRFDGIPFITAETGAPLLTSAIAWADCRVEETLVAGDHQCFIGRVLALGAGAGDEEEALMYYLNRYRRPR